MMHKYNIVFWQRIGISIGLAVLLATLFGVPIAAEAPIGYQEYYILGNEELVWRAFRTIFEGPSSAMPPNMCSTINLVATNNYQVIYYDHWEDGYEEDLLNPSQGTTEIYALTLGQTLSLTSTAGVEAPPLHQYVPVSPTRNLADLRYDGGDRILSSGGPIALSHAVWPYNSSWAGGAWEIYSYETRADTYAYHIPIGEDLYIQGGGNEGLYGDFRYVYLHVSPYENDTTLFIDNGAGQQVNVTLNRGQTYSSQGYVNSTNVPSISVKAGTTLITNKPVQVGLLTGSDSPNNGFQGRFLVIRPTQQWGADYVVPVPRAYSAAVSREINTEFYIANPNRYPITVQAYDHEGQHTFTISQTRTPSATLPYSLIRGGYAPAGHAVRFTSSEGVFNVVMAADTSNTNYDWGLSAIPNKYLTQDYYVPWAPGNALQPPNQSVCDSYGNSGGTSLCRNSSPLWVAPTTDGTVFYVDYSPVDGAVDNTFTLNALEQRRIFDPDYDNTGTHIWATEKFACIWGEDPQTAGISYPNMDVGVSILPLKQNWLAPLMSLQATAAPAIVPPTGGVVTLTLALHARQGDIGNLSLTNTLPLKWAYLPDTAFITLPGGSVIPAEPQVVTQTLTWTPDVTLQSMQTLTVSFQAEITDTTGVSAAINHATALGEHLQSTVLLNPYDDVTLYVNPLNLAQQVSHSQALIGQTLVYTLTYKNFGATLPTTNTTLRTVLPLHYVAFVAASAGGNYQPTGGTLTWNVGNLAPGAGGSVTFTVRIHNFLEDGVLIENIGQISSEETDSVQSNPARTTVQAARLTLTTAGPIAVYPGDSLTYTLTYHNQGSVDAWDVLISNTIPLSTTYIPGSLSILTGTMWVPLTDASGDDIGEYNDPDLTIRPGHVPAGAVGQIRYRVQVTTEDIAGRTILNTATLAHQQGDLYRSNLFVTHILALRLWKQAAQTVALPGTAISYTLTYQNLSTGQYQTNIAVLEALPAHTQLISGSVSGADLIAYSEDGIQWRSTPLTTTNYIRWRDFSLSPQTTVTLTLALQVNAVLSPSVTIQNQAQISSTQSYLAAREWLTSNAVNLPTFDIWLEKQAGAATLYAGETLTYTFQIYNNGSLEAAGLRLTDTLPTGAAYLPNSIYGPGSDDTQAPQLRWEPDIVLPNTGLTFGYTARIDSSLTPGTILTNVVQMETPYRRYTSAPVTVTIASAADLRLNKTVFPTSVRPNAVLTYTLYYTNSGPSDAQTVFLGDFLPAEVEFGSIIAMTPALQGPTQYEQLIVWYTPTLAAHSTGAVTYTVLLGDTAALSLTNSAHITATTTELTPDDNAAQTTTPIIQFVDLTLAQESPVSVIGPGEPLTYVLRFANIGIMDANNTTVRDALPENFVVTAIHSEGVPPRLVETDPAYVWALDAFPINAWGIITLTGSITPGLAGGVILTNTACITNTSMSDSAPGNNCAAVASTMINVPPQPRPDHILVTEGGSTSVLSDGGDTVLSNDSDPNQDALTVTLTPLLDVAHGTLLLQANGTFTYTHDGSEERADGFIYQVCDAGAPPLCAEAEVSITVTSANGSPVAADDILTVTEGSYVHLPAPGVLSNDTDPDLPPDTLATSLITAPAFGTLILLPDGALTYTHAGGEEPYDSFRYRVCDDGAPQLCDSALVSITVLPTADPPVAVDDALIVSEGGVTTTLITGESSVLANDYDPDLPPAPLTATLTSNVMYGALTLAADGAFTYTHDGSENHSDHFVYQACKTTAPQLCDTATVVITVTAINDPPTISALPDMQLYVNAVSAPHPFTVSDIDTPPAALTLTADSSDTALAPPAQIVFSGSDVTRALTLTPGAGLTGTARITVSVNDGASSASSAFTLTVIPRPPIYLPAVMRNWPVYAPDLVVESITVTAGNVQLVIANHGLTAVTQPFWVDAYVRPITAPTQVNQTWKKMGNEGIVWGVLWDALPLEPGESLQLWYNGPYYDALSSHVNWPIRAGDWVYAQVDSANLATNYGGILETHEINGQPYNNILGVQFSGNRNSLAPPPQIALPSPHGADLPRRE